MSQDNPYDEKNIRSYDFRVRATLEPKHDNPDMMTLTLAVGDGPETYTHFDPKVDLNLDGENPLTEAITKGVNLMIEAAQMDEAGHWIADHDTAYLVQGQTGRQVTWPERKQTWTVKAFASEERAHDLMQTLNHWCLSHGLARVSYEDPMKRLIIDPEGKVAKCPHDPGFRIDETGVLYTIVKVPLDMFDPIGV